MTSSVADARSISNSHTVDSNDALTKVNKIPVMSFTDIDTGRQVGAGLVCQSVVAALPEAVRSIKEFLPNVFRSGDFDPHQRTVQVQLPAEAGLHQGDTVRLQTVRGQSTAKIEELTENGFKIDAASAEKVLAPDNKVFVYGVEAGDVLQVDTNQILALTVSGVQQLAAATNKATDGNQGIEHRVTILEEKSESHTASQEELTQRLSQITTDIEQKAERADIADAVDGLRGDVNASIDGLRTVVDGKATTADVETAVDGLRGDVNASIDGLRTVVDGKAAPADVEAAVDGLRGDLTGSIDGLRTVVDGKATSTDVDGLRGDLTTSIDGLRTVVDGKAAPADVEAAVDGLRGDLTASIDGLRTVVDGKATSTDVDGLRGDLTASIDGLRTVVDGKAAPADVEAAVDGLRGDLTASIDGLRTVVDGKATSADVETAVDGLRGDLTASIDGLRTVVDGKATTADVETAVDGLRGDLTASIDGLRTVVDGKATSADVEAAVDGLQDDLTASIDGLRTVVDGKAAPADVEAAVDGLRDDLTATIDGLRTAVDGKATLADIQSALTSSETQLRQEISALSALVEELRGQVSASSSTVETLRVAAHADTEVTGASPVANWYAPPPRSTSALTFSQNGTGSIIDAGTRQCFFRWTASGSTLTLNYLNLQEATAAGLNPNAAQIVAFAPENKTKVMTFRIFDVPMGWRCLKMQGQTGSISISDPLGIRRFTVPDSIWPTGVTAVNSYSVRHFFIFQ